MGRHYIYRQKKYLLPNFYLIRIYLENIESIANKLTFTYFKRFANSEK